MKSLKQNRVTKMNEYDVIIIGGSYSGLAAGMALGRALRKVLIIDSHQPCNTRTLQSHNFLTHDGKTPSQIATLGRKQVKQYETVDFVSGVVSAGRKTANRFEIETSNKEAFVAKKLIFATGIKDLIPDIKGFSECWGISVLHCPYCHGYEVRGKETAVLGNGDSGFEFAMLISNWTSTLTLLTNGAASLTGEKRAKLEEHRIKVIEKKITHIDHMDGHLQCARFADAGAFHIEVLYARLPFQQHSDIPNKIGCELSDDGYIKVDSLQKTSIPGIFACGDSTSRMRTVANAVATGTTTGMMVNKEIIQEEF
jgi:thioredoxin reductase